MQAKEKERKIKDSDKWETEGRVKRRKSGKSEWDERERIQFSVGPNGPGCRTLLRHRPVLRPKPPKFIQGLDKKLP
jgi:hypothetical protein